MLCLGRPIHSANTLVSGRNSKRYNSEALMPPVVVGWKHFAGLGSHTGRKAFEFWHFDDGETSPSFFLKRALLEAHEPQVEEVSTQAWVLRTYSS